MQALTYHKHTKRTERAKIFWRQVVREYKGGKSVQDIANSYINPQTGRTYSRYAIYKALRKAHNNEI